MLVILFWIAITYTTWFAVFLVQSVTGAMLAHSFGAKVESVSVGCSLFSRLSVQWEGRYWKWRIGWLPFCSVAHFSADDAEVDEFDRDNIDLAPSSFHRLRLWQAIVVFASGPIAIGLVGVALLFIPVLFGSNQLALVQKNDSTISPIAVSGLKLQAQASTADNQLEFVKEVFVEGAPKYLLFQPSDGWGGLVGCVVTQVSVGVESGFAWSAFVGCVLVIWGTVQFLPVAFLPGYQILQAVGDAFFGRKRMWKLSIFSAYIGLVYMAAICIRMILADAYWILEVFNG